MAAVVFRFVSFLTYVGYLFLFYLMFWMTMSGYSFNERGAMMQTIQIKSLVAALVPVGYAFLLLENLYSRKVKLIIFNSLLTAGLLSFYGTSPVLPGVVALVAVGATFLLLTGKLRQDWL